MLSSHEPFNASRSKGKAVLRATSHSLTSPKHFCGLHNRAHPWLRNIVTGKLLKHYSHFSSPAPSAWLPPGAGLRLHLRPRPAPVAAVANSVHEDLVPVTTPVGEAATVGLQQETVLGQRREPWAIAQDHVIPASASVAAFASAEAWIGGALVRAVATLVPQHVCTGPFARGKLH